MGINKDKFNRVSGISTGRKQCENSIHRNGMAVADSQACPGGIESHLKRKTTIFEFRFPPPGQYFPYCFLCIEYQSLSSAMDTMEHTCDK